LAFEMQYKDDIQERMKEAFRQESGKTVIEGGFARDVINANSLEFENTYLEMHMILEASFADTSWGEFLTRKCAEFGVDRKLATYSVGEVTFTGEKNRTIPAGTRVGIAGGNQYTTDETVTTGEDGTATVGITCETIGSVGNVAEDLITDIPISITGIRTVTNAEPTHDGYDEETDEELYARYYVFVRTPATSGNKYHYFNWASEVEGVGAVRIFPLWNGPGTVKVLFLDSNHQTASEELIQKVYEHIEENRPIGADVTVVSPQIKEVTIDVAVKGTLDVDALIAEIMEYAKGKGLDLTYISEAQVGDMIMNQSAVEDYVDLSLNGAKRVTFGTEEILAIKEVVLHDYNP